MSKNKYNLMLEELHIIEMAYTDVLEMTGSTITNKKQQRKVEKMLLEIGEMVDNLRGIIEKESKK